VDMNTKNEEEPNSQSFPLWKKIMIGIAAILVPFLLYKLGETYGKEILAWTATIGIWGNVVIVCFLIFASFPWAFGTQLTSMVCGFLYQLWLGAFTVLIGVTIGCSAAFMLLRYFLKDKINGWVGRGKTIQYVIQAINQEPIKFGLLIRALPLTTGIQTSILSITNIDFPTFLWTSLVAEMPQHFIFVYLGTQISDLTQILSGTVPWRVEQVVLIAIQVLGGILVMITVISIGRNALMKMEKEVPV